MSAEMAQHRWVRRDVLGWMLVAQGVSIFPLFFYLPLWLPCVWLLAMVWRVQIFRGAWPFPNNKIKTVMGLTGIAALLMTYAGTLGVEPLVSFLVLSFVLKLVEVRSRKDVLLVIYVGYISVATQFLFSQTVLISVYGVLSVLVLLAAWNNVYRSDAIRVSEQLASSGVLLLQSLPLMLVLFLVLPRMGTLWHVPMPKSSGVTGFSDQMSPGDFSQLSQSRAVAFRVGLEAVDAVPPRKEWYWRGLVLDFFDGRVWHHRSNAFRTRGEGASQVPEHWQLVLPPQSRRFRYTVLLEPHQQTWLFTLMAPLSAQSSMLSLQFSQDYLLRARRPIASRSQYEVVSARDYRAHPVALSGQDARNLTTLPPSHNPRAQALARQWRSEGRDDAAMVQAALDFYRASFYYTLQPPALGYHSVDEFLFQTQRGFCEHFASSFVVLMRAADIPARVVVGYQGGEFNVDEAYIIVRQADAHAWAEVWLADEGWVRVDPTAAVAPSRIERGLNESLDPEDRVMVESLFSGGLLSGLQLRLDAWSFHWHKWVLSYDQSAQAGLFERLLGGTSATRIAVFFIATVGSLLLLYFLLLTWRGRKRYRYAEEREYQRVLKKLARMGYTPQADESASAFLSRVAGEREELAQKLTVIANLYTKIAYQERREALTLLRRAINRL